MNEWDGSRMGESLDTPTFSIISDIAENHLGENYEDGNSCDEWAAKILAEANFSPDKYCMGDTSQTVRQHINDLKNKEVDFSTTAEASAYVVFMGDGTRPYSRNQEHAGLMVINTSGNVSFYHSSRSNTGGLSSKETYNSVSSFETAFAYSSFYYQEIR